MSARTYKFVDMEFCRICLNLAVDGMEMHPIEHTPYREIFEWCTQDMMDTNTKFPNSICNPCNALLNKQYDFLKNMIQTEIYLKETLRNTSKITYESVEKFKKEMISKRQNQGTEGINNLETPKLHEQELKSHQQVSVLEECCKNNKEKSVENDQQKPPEENIKNQSKQIDKDSETIAVQDYYAADDDDEIEEDIKLVWSPDTEDEAPDIPTIEIEDDAEPIIENENSSEQKITDKYHIKDSILQNFQFKSEENIFEESVTTNKETDHKAYLKFMEERITIGKELQEKKMIMNAQSPHSVYYICKVVLNRLEDSNKNTNDTEIFNKKPVCDKYKMLFESDNKLKKEIISIEHNLPHEETKEIKNADTGEKCEVEIEKIKVSETPKEKSKLPEQKSKSLHPVHKESSKHSEVPQEHIKNKPEQIRKDSETTAVQDDYTADNDDEEDIKLVWSSDIEDESPNTLNTIDHDPIIENNPNNSSEKMKTTTNLEKNHSPYLKFIKKRTSSEEETPNKRLKTSHQRVETSDQRVETSDQRVVTSNQRVGPSDLIVKPPNPKIYQNEYLEFIKHVEKESENVQMPREIELDYQEDGNVEVKIESVGEEFEGSLEEYHEDNVVSDTGTFNIEETEELIENSGQNSHEIEDSLVMRDTNNDMELHEIQTKKKDARFVCSLCQKSFDTIIGVRQHAVVHIL